MNAAAEESPASNVADVVVVGGGGAGLAAAAAAGAAGASVIVLEKNPFLGGTTALSIGSITATGSPHQKRRGIVDTPDEHFMDMGLFAGTLEPRDNLALRRVLVDNVPETLRWLISLGLTFFGPMPEPPHRKPRMHNVLPNSRAYAYALERECRRWGVTIQLGARAKGLLRQGARVVGVAAEVGRTERRFIARRAVILASGDYTASRSLKSQYRPDLADVDAINPASTGDGQELGLELGAAIKNGDLLGGPHMRFNPPPRPSLVLKLPPWRPLTWIMRQSLEKLPDWFLRPFILSFVTTFLAPELSLYQHGAILVNKAGRRFCDELDKPAFAISEQPDKLGHIVFDDVVAQKFAGWPNFISTASGVAYAYLPDYKRTRPDVYHQAQDLDGLADRIGVPREALRGTVSEYNAALSSAANRPDASGIARQPIGRAPYYALGPVKSWVVLGDGGLTVTTRHQVTQAGGTVIPGLYAAGSTGQGGLLLAGHGHHLGWAFTSGRLAGRNAAQEQPVEASQLAHLNSR